MRIASSSERKIIGGVVEEDYQFIGLSISAMAEDEKSNITDAEVENLQDLMMDLEDANRKFLNAAKKLLEKK